MFWFQLKEENSSDQESKVYSQDIKIKFVKAGGEWLVDSAVWQ